MCQIHCGEYLSQQLCCDGSLAPHAASTGLSSPSSTTSACLFVASASPASASAYSPSSYCSTSTPSCTSWGPTASYLASSPSVPSRDVPCHASGHDQCLEQPVGWHADVLSNANPDAEPHDARAEHLPVPPFHGKSDTVCEPPSLPALFHGSSHESRTALATVTQV